LLPGGTGFFSGAPLETALGADILYMKLNLWSLLLKLPSFIKTPILRRVVFFPTSISNSLHFKVAETQDELEQAFKLLHDAYVRENLMSPHPSGMRITKYHTLPSTTTLIAVENNVVVGTVSLIRQSSFGLPLKSIFDISDVPASARLAEVSALAIKTDQLHQRGRILFPLLKFLTHYSRDYFGVTHFVIAVNPKWIDFYKSILLFKPLAKKPVKNYSFVNGAPAVGGILDIEKLPQIFYKAYGNKPNNKNLYKFFIELERTNMFFPLRKKSVITDPMLSPKLLEHFFIKKSSCLNEMTGAEHSILREMYDYPEYLNLIPEGNVVNFRKRRNNKRLEITLEGRLLLQNEQSVPLNIHDVSLHGFGGFAAKSLELQGSHKVLINIEDFAPCELVGKFVHVEATGRFGFEVNQSCHRWRAFIDHLDSRIQVISDQSLARWVANQNQ